MLCAEDGSPEPRRARHGLARSLCISTGTKDVDAALVAAGHRLPGTGVREDSPLAARRARRPPFRRRCSFRMRTPAAGEGRCG
ncbi:DUF5133 domain-containing protein [Streptomyces chrestomyceticus]|uniref:DUF5133 domain-containing protein n=1 Tax=Streptomyces chrestomyceticus TaxID=68185 RepID=UPI00378EF236